MMGSPAGEASPAPHTGGAGPGRAGWASRPRALHIASRAGPIAPVQRRRRPGGMGCGDRTRGSPSCAGADSAAHIVLCSRAKKGPRRPLSWRSLGQSPMGGPECPQQPPHCCCRAPGHCSLPCRRPARQRPQARRRRPRRAARTMQARARRRLPLPQPRQALGHRPHASRICASRVRTRPVAAPVRAAAPPSGPSRRPTRRANARPAAEAGRADAPPTPQASFRRLSAQIRELEARRQR